jgi:hypothetical protein
MMWHNCFLTDDVLCILIITSSMMLSSMICSMPLYAATVSHIITLKKATYSTDMILCECGPVPEFM